MIEVQKLAQAMNNKLASHGEPKLRFRSALLSFFLITGLLTGCGSDSNDKSADTLTFTQATITATVGDAPSAPQTASGGKGTGAITYTSDTPTVATVDASGVVTIVGAGAAIITATRASDANYRAATATYSLTVNKAIDNGLTRILKYYAKASNTDEVDLFGTSVALSANGSTLAIGAAGEDSNAKNTDTTPNQADDSSANAGAVYVFTRSGAGWSQQAYLKASNTDASDQFGISVALSADGNTLAVGAVGEASSARNTDTTPNQADNRSSNAGAVYVFTRTGTSWGQESYLKASNTDANDQFGQPVALSGDGNTLAVGAIGEDSSAVDAGAVYVFTRTGANWSQESYLEASNTGAGDQFGTSVALSDNGNTLAVGAIGEDSNAKNTDTTPNQSDNSASSAGAVYVFTRTGTSWSQESYLKASNTDEADEFGVRVALASDGNTLAVSAIGEDSNAKNTDTTLDQEDDSAINAGAVYVFTRAGMSWGQQAYLKTSNTGGDDPNDDSDRGDRLASVALSADGNTLVVGAFGEDSNAKNTDTTPDQADDSASSAGAAYVFTRTGANWSQQTYLKASNTDAKDRFGISVALSADGNTLAVGAIGEDSNAKNADATPDQEDGSASGAGAVYIY